MVDAPGSSRFARHIRVLSMSMCVVETWKVRGPGTRDQRARLQSGQDEMSFALSCERLRKLS